MEDARPFFSAYFIIMVVCLLLSANLQQINNILDYKTSIVYQSGQYITEHLPKGSKITYDVFVYIPTGYVPCQFWSSCGNLERVEKFQPDYVVFNPDYLRSPNTIMLKKFIAKHAYRLIDTIKASGITVSVYKKP